MSTEFDVLKLRRATAAAWAAQNPIPEQGEPCYETDTHVLRIGTGIDHYNDLSGFNSGTVYTSLSDDYEIDPITGQAIPSYTQETIEAALIAIGTTALVTLLIAPGTWPITSNTVTGTTPLAGDYSAYTNVTWKVVPGAILQIATGITLTISGPFEAGLYQVFQCDGTGKVVFGNGSVKEVYPEWWATNTDPVNTDMTVAIQSAINTLKPSVLSASQYKVTDTLYFSDTCSLKGQNNYPATTLESDLQVSALTKIIFSPASEKDLFDITTLAGGNGVVSKVYIGGIYCIGDTTGGVTNSKYGINSKAAQSSFENLGFEQFQTGIYCNFTMTNRYSNVYLGNMSSSCISTSTNTSTTDIFDNVIMRASPWGVILVHSVSFRFINCLFESLTTGGVNLYKDAAFTSFVDCYGENVPSTNAGSSYGMFYINHSGSTLGGGTSIVGGLYGGENTHQLYGSFADINYTNYLSNVSITNVGITRYTNGIKANTTNSDPYSIYSSGNIIYGVTNQYVNPVKVTGALYDIIFGDITNSTIGGNFPTLKSYIMRANLFSLRDISTNGILNLRTSSNTLNDGAEIEYGSFGVGLFLVTMSSNTIHEAGLFSVSIVAGPAASVIKLIGTANTSITDLAANLCVFPVSTSIKVKNNLGDVVTVKILQLQ